MRLGPRCPEASSAEIFVAGRDLAGKRVARGEFKAINGVWRGFTAYLDGTWDGQALTLVEDFEFDDGERDRKTWRLERTGPGCYTGTREDVVGEATGFQDGAAFRLEYVMRLPSEEGPGRVFRFRDVMVLDATGDVLNDATIGWRGLRVGSVALRIEPVGAKILPG